MQQTNKNKTKKKYKNKNKNKTKNKNKNEQNKTKQKSNQGLIHPLYHNMLCYLLLFQGVLFSDFLVTQKKIEAIPLGNLIFSHFDEAYTNVL